MAFKKHILMVLTFGILSGCGGSDGGHVDVDPKTRIENESVETLWVSHHQYWNPNDWPGPSLSLIVSSGTTPDFSIERRQTISSVSGFVYEPGYVYRIRVKKTRVIHLADVPVFTYSWMATEQKLAAVGQIFEFVFPKTQNYRRNGTSIKLLNLQQEYTCEMVVCESIDELMYRPDVAEVVLSAKVELPGQPIVFTAVKAINLAAALP